MGTEGLEPSRTITRQRILSPSCLPIPPRPLTGFSYIIFYMLIKSNDIELYLKAAPRFELGIEDLQSTALPLGHTAINIVVFKYNMNYNLK